MKKRPLFYLGIISVLLFLTVGCGSSEKDSKSIALNDVSLSNSSNRDLTDLKKEGKLRALTIYSATSYFLYKGQPMGYEYELLKRFAEYLDVELEMIVVENLDEMIVELNKGTGDILAHGLTITSDRQKWVSFTDYLYLTHQVLVQKKPDNWLRMPWYKLEKSLVQDAIELIGDSVTLRESSSYHQRISNLSNEIGGDIYVKPISGEFSTDEIIKMVVDGKVKYTVSDNNIASIMASYYPILDIDVPISFSQKIAWATRHNSGELLNAANNWLKDFKKEVDYNVIYNKYFKNKKGFRKREKSEFYSLNTQEISAYDKIIKKYADFYNSDWRLLASLIYQESKFNPKNTSWVNAAGLMQLMPATAKELGVTNRFDPEQSIKGGTKYLKQLWGNFENVPDSIQRLKFAMASYNCGLQHVKDAQSLARKRNLDPTIWDNNVDQMILALSSQKNYKDPVVKYGYVRGDEPFNYVNQIFERYNQYKQFIKQ